jgi:hypothetical protein
MTFGANRYDPSQDPEYPKVGSTYDNGAKTVLKAQHMEVGDLLKMVAAGARPEPLEGAEEDVDIIDNTTRPFLKYLVWYKTNSDVIRGTD